MVNEPLKTQTAPNKAFKSIWLDKNTYLLLKKWANWKKPPFKKRLKLKRALIVLLYCGIRYYLEHRNNADLQFPDVFQMQERQFKKSILDFTSEEKLLNYKNIWLDTRSHSLLKRTASAMTLPMKYALPIIVDWGMVFYSMKMLKTGAPFARIQNKLQQQMMQQMEDEYIPKEVREMFPPFLWHQ